jgi:hypothetical protein
MTGWCVYRHTFPDGCVYIGITGRPENERWKNGFGYEHERKMFSAIVAQGWNNVKHETLFSGLTEEKAKGIEKRLIMKSARLSKNKILNVQHNPKDRQNKSWIDLNITEESARQYSSQFMLLDDYWLEKYKHLRGYFPFSTKISVGYVTLLFFEMKNGKVDRYEYRIDYPDYVSTFRDLHDFLMTGAPGEWAQQEPIAVPAARGTT